MANEKTIKVKIRGVTPLLMHNSVGADPTNEGVIELKKMTAIKKKTLDIYEKIKICEMRVSLYYDDEIGPYIPAEMVEALIRDAAKTEKLGKAMKVGLIADPEKIPLIYKGPRDIDTLCGPGEFRDSRVVRNQQNRILRTRPIFFPWGAEFEIRYSPSLHNPDSILHFIGIGGKLCGIGDFRPRYGRFEVTK